MSRAFRMEVVGRFYSMLGDSSWEVGSFFTFILLFLG